MFLNSSASLSIYLFCNSRIHGITLYSGHVCVYYASMLRCWHLVWILVRTDHPSLGVGCHTCIPSQICVGCHLSLIILNTFWVRRVCHGILPLKELLGPACVPRYLTLKGADILTISSTYKTQSHVDNSS
jgi:hypothetical protein